MAASEFTPEITNDFYENLAKRIRTRGETTAGQARSEALSRGLGGDPYEASAVGLARNGTNNELASLDSDLNFKVAGLNRDERLTRENREDTQSFESGESEKERAFRERIARAGWDWQGDQANTQNRRNMQSALWQIPLGGVARGAGAYFGGL